jgi:hypothetical protein
MGPVRHALLEKSREAALTAVQTYNNPLVKFKSESFIVLMMIAWTYLLHAHYSHEKVDFRYLDHDPGSKRKYVRTPEGGYKWWDLSACVKATQSPLDRGTALNLAFLIGLRDEIEHHRPPHLDDRMSGRYLACALNYEYWLTTLFGSKYGLGDTVAMALHFRDIRPIDEPVTARLPAGIARYVERFEGAMTQDEYDDPRFAYRLLFTRRTANHKGQADRAVEFIKPGDPGSEGIEADRWLIKEMEKRKFRARDVIAVAQAAGFRFGKWDHTQLWKRLDGKNPERGFGVWVDTEWFWYETWVDEVLRQCQVQAGDVVESRG